MPSTYREGVPANEVPMMMPGVVSSVVAAALLVLVILPTLSTYLVGAVTGVTGAVLSTVRFNAALRPDSLPAASVNE